MSEATECPRCKSGDKSERKYVTPFPGFAMEPCQHQWHGRSTDGVQAIIQRGCDELEAKR